VERSHLKGASVHRHLHPQEADSITLVRLKRESKVQFADYPGVK
jgi:hypothetical protein